MKKTITLVLAAAILALALCGCSNSDKNYANNAGTDNPGTTENNGLVDDMLTGDGDMDLPEPDVNDGVVNDNDGVITDSDTGSELPDKVTEEVNKAGENSVYTRSDDSAAGNGK